MKPLLIIPIILLSIGCKQSSSLPPPCSGRAGLGSWYDSNANDTLTLNDTCQGTGTYCAETFTFSLPNDSDGQTTTVITTKTNGNPGCLALGNHTCQFKVTDNTSLYINCGSGGVTYVKK